MIDPAKRTPPKIPRPEPAPLTSSPIVAEFERRVAADPGASQELAAAFWRTTAAALPLIEPCGDDPSYRIVTFIWNAPRAHEIILFVNRLTDERRLHDSTMKPISGTGLWQLSYRMRSDWRASYAALVREPGSPAPWQQGDQISIRQALDRGQPDPHNRARCRNRAGVEQSVAQLPDAPHQTWLAPREPPVAAGKVTQVLTPNSARIWEYLPADTSASELPILVVFDGDVWTGPQDLATTLDNLIADGLIPPVYAAMIDSGDRASRWKTLDEGGEMIHFVCDELLPWARSRYRLSSDPHDVVAVGQSLGALTAVRLGVTASDHVGGVVSQSASVWQDQVFADIAAQRRIDARMYIEVGSQEWILQPPHRKLIDALSAAGAELEYREFNGGHDYACWRGGVADGLIWYFGTESVRGSV